ncbi:Leucyl-tRNA synthetase [Candidatus Nasuia deltocephalinicola]|uniref:leucine--tRNA ligase n=1 Tax=Candidatus Nasuia deltocephalincola TaxID=1160784 RepID=A0A7G6UHQ4_9PROT|nr:Leucyl-tRNA synthetase [Candidatus Nasuia deltocephalinicola]
MFFKTNNNIPMIPYPSGKIHIGHFRNYMINDIYNRFLFLINYKSKMLISWDAFGTPAENASIKNNMFPINYLKKNIFFMKKQLKSSSLSILWKKEFKTSDPNYYLFNQMLIFKLIKNNLLYISNKKINWDDCDKTVLSNEQVIKGVGWRSSCVVCRKNILTYYFKINYVINEIYKEIENLDWPDRVKIMQKNWIFNKYFYYYFYFNFFRKKMKKVFFLKNFFSFFHFFSKKVKFLNRISKLLNSSYFISNIYLNIKIEFWFLKKKKIYFLNYKNIFLKYFYFKKLPINIRYKFKGLTILEFLILFKIKKFIILKIKLKIKDWGISRQRYWGCPIPIYYCKKCKKFYNSNFKDFPILISKNLKNNINYFKILSNLIKCRFCSFKSFKEIGTNDTFIDSSWYFLKYFKKNYEYNLVFPIDLYVGGIEHAILHLFYSRYIFKILRNLKYLNFGEPVKKLFSQGIILNKILDFEKIKIEKMSKSKNNTITPDEISKNYSVDSLRVSILRNPFNKNFIWREDVIKNSNSFFKNIFKKLNFILKEKFFKKYFFFYKYKIIYNFIINNLKNFLYLISKIYYDKIIISLFKIFKIINFKKIFNIFIIKDIYFKILKNFFIFLPSLVRFWKLLKFKNILKINFKEFYFKILLKNSYKFKKVIVLINNRIIGVFFLSKLKKKKIFNFIFFKKKIFKKNIYKIIFINNSVEIITYSYS